MIIIDSPPNSHIAIKSDNLSMNILKFQKYHKHPQPSVHNRKYKNSIQNCLTLSEEQHKYSPKRPFHWDGSECTSSSFSLSKPRWSAFSSSTSSPRVRACLSGATYRSNGWFPLTGWSKSRFAYSSSESTPLTPVRRFIMQLRCLSSNDFTKSFLFFLAFSLSSFFSVRKQYQNVVKRPKGMKCYINFNLGWYTVFC